MELRDGDRARRLHLELRGRGGRRRRVALAPEDAVARVDVGGHSCCMEIMGIVIYQLI